MKKRCRSTSAMNAPPQIGFYRIKEVLKIYPVSKSVLLSGVKSCVYPKPVKKSAKCSVWKIADIDRLVAEVSA